MLRRLIRRAARHGRLLGIDGQFLARPFRKRNRRLQRRISGAGREEGLHLQGSEQRGRPSSTRPSTRDLHILSEYGRKNAERRQKQFWPVQDAFKLYDTYGFPLDLTKEILEEKGYGIDEDGFHAAMEEQREQCKIEP